MAIFSGNSDEIKVHLDRLTPCVLKNLTLKWIIAYRRADGCETH
jgi:hypothetical protein